MARRKQKIQSFGCERRRAFAIVADCHDAPFRRRFLDRGDHGENMQRDVAIRAMRALILDSARRC